MKTIGLLLTMLFFTGLKAEAQWSAVDSGTTNILRGIYLVDSGTAYSVGDSGTILKSTDGGVTWDALISGTTKALYDVFFFNDSEGVVVGDGGLILRTADGGANWTTVPSGVRDGLRTVHFSGADGICGGLSQDIIYSSDSGVTWQVSQKGFFGGGFFGAQMLSPTLGVITGQNSIFQGLQGTTVDGGVHWTFHPFYFNGNEGSASDIFFFDDMTGISSGVLFDGTGAIARTSDGGTDWNSTLFPQGVQGIDFPNPAAGFAVGFGGTILRSNDLGLTWSAQTSGTFVDLFAVHFASDGLTGLAVGDAGTILRTTNGGQAGGLELVAANSVKDDFAVDLPLTDAPGIECRSGGSKSNFTVNLIFNNPLTSVDSVTASCGNVSSFAIDPGDTHQLSVRLTRVTCNAQLITLTVTGAHDDQGNSLPAVDMTFGLLLGDVNGDGVVNNADGNEIKADRGQITDSRNFREDINTNGRIDAGDLAIVKAHSGTMLPPASPAMFVADKDDNSVIRANLDGSDAIDLGNIGGLLTNPTAIAVNSAAGKLYVVNGSGNSVVMSNLDGSNPVNLTFGGLLQVPYGIALDAAGGKIYVSVNVGPSPVVRANLDGSGAEGLGDFGGPFGGLELTGMDVDTAHGKIYVAANSGPEGQIARVVEADLADGGNAVALDFGGSFYAPLDVKVDVAGNNLYVVDFSSLIYRSDLNGNGVVNLGVVAGPFPSFLALDLVGGKMYISASHTVTQADLPDGKNPVALIIPSLGTPAGIAIYRPSH